MADKAGASSTKRVGKYEVGKTLGCVARPLARAAPRRAAQHAACAR
jgi:hypothetical protein